MAFKMKGFKAHNMYKTKKANTKADHDRLEKQGYDHSPYNKKNKDGKEQGVDGRACWKGFRYAGTKDGSDKCVKM